MLYNKKMWKQVHKNFLESENLMITLKRIKIIIDLFHSYPIERNI